MVAALRSRQLGALPVNDAIRVKSTPFLKVGEGWKGSRKRGLCIGTGVLEVRGWEATSRETPFLSSSRYKIQRKRQSSGRDDVFVERRRNEREHWGCGSAGHGSIRGWGVGVIESLCWTEDSARDHRSGEDTSPTACSDDITTTQGKAGTASWTEASGSTTEASGSTTEASAARCFIIDAGCTTHAISGTP